MVQIKVHWKSSRKNDMYTTSYTSNKNEIYREFAKKKKQGIVPSTSRIHLIQRVNV